MNRKALIQWIFTVIHYLYYQVPGVIYKITFIGLLAWGSCIFIYYYLFRMLPGYALWNSFLPIATISLWYMRKTFFRSRFVRVVKYDQRRLIGRIRKWFTDATEFFSAATLAALMVILFHA